MNATTARPKITVTADGRGVVSHAGSRLLADLATTTGLDAGSDIRHPVSLDVFEQVTDRSADRLADFGERFPPLVAMTLTRPLGSICSAPPTVSKYAGTAPPIRSWRAGVEPR